MSSCRTHQTWSPWNPVRLRLPTYPSRADRVSLARTVFSYSRGRRTGRAIPHLQQAARLVGECNVREPLAERGGELERVVACEERDRPCMPNIELVTAAG